MQLARFPRGREHNRSIDAAPVPHPPLHEEAPAPAAAGPGGPVLDSSWVGWKVTDELGRAVGRVEGTAQPDWLIVRDRRGHHLLAPAEDAIAGGAAVFLPFDHEVIVTAPQLAGGADPDDDAISAAREHYHLT